MKILKLIQGTPDWHAHRATHLNASDAPAMLGASPYKTRDQLIREKATGITPEVDSSTQKRFDDGHRFEALARPLAETIVGEDLFPCVGEDGKFSASFDGLTMLGDTAFEHKSLNDTLRAAMPFAGLNENVQLPDTYRIQNEHQCMVSGAERVLFMASTWNGDELVEERHCWYEAHLGLRSQLTVGWSQFEEDVAAYQPEESAPVIVVAGRAPEQLPALRVEVTGMVTASNLVEFKANAMAVLGNINRDLLTDEDFADADKTVKWCKDVEERLELTKQQVLGQTADIAAVFKTMDEVAEETRRVRLDLDRLVKSEKERRRSEIVAAGVNAVRSHYESINATLGQHALQVPAGLQSLIGEAIKGKKNLTSIREAASGAAANAKIDASQTAERVRANIAVLNEHVDHAHLFADRVQLCAAKATDDLRNLASARIAEHREQEERRQEEMCERIRTQERENAEAERALVVAEAPKPVEPTAMPTTGPGPTKPYVEAVNDLIGAGLKAPESPLPFDTTSATSGRTIKLGEINARIAPLSITADGLNTLGFQPVSTDRAAKLYAQSDLLLIYRAIWRVIEAAGQAEKKAA